MIINPQTLEDKMTFKLIANAKNRKIELRIEDNKQSTVRGIRQAFYFLGKDLKATTEKNILALPRIGTPEVFRGKKRRASIRGETFADRSGDARRQLGFSVKGGDQLEFGFRQDAKTFYTKILEEQMRRPTLKIATNSNARNARKHFEKEIERAHKEGFR